MKQSATLYSAQQGHAVWSGLWPEIKAHLMAGHRLRVEVKPATKSSEQERRYHAMIAEVAKQSDYAGKRWDADDMKRILVDEFADAMRKAGTPLHHDGRLIPSEDGRRVIQLGVQTRDFHVKEASEFIEFLFAWGADRSVKWADPTIETERETT